MIFVVPWAWLGLLAVPLLAAIYLLRQRARRRTVSSLLLWRHEPPRRDSGRRLDRFRAPPLFWLELAIVLLLVTAALGPRIPTPETRRPLVVVLDDSFSMRAGGDDSPLESARAALADELGSSLHLTATLIAAAESPRLLGRGAGTSRQAAEALEEWRATAPSTAIAEALELAAQLGGPRARLLVVSDHAPAQEPEDPRLAWWSFGRPRANLALVQAVRATSAAQTGPDPAEEVSCLLEVANYSERPASARLRINLEGASDADPPPPSRPPALESLTLEAGAKARVRFGVPAGRTVVAELDADALTLDDRIVLLPEEEPPVRVRNSVSDPPLARLLEETLIASGRARLVQERIDLVVTDGSLRADASGTAAGAWTVRIAAGPAGGSPIRPFLGPFVIDHEHPLAEGLSLGGVIWAGRDPGIRGRAVVSAADVPLLVEAAGNSGSKEVVLAFEERLSTLQRTPSWPVLWWNLLEWRSASLPGMRPRNARLGEPLVLSLDDGVDAVRWRAPGSREIVLGVSSGRVELIARDLGIHEALSERRLERFAVNALAPAESDLRGATSGRWGDWQAAERASWGYRPLGWFFLLAALALMILHLSWTQGDWTKGRWAKQDRTEASP